MWVSDVHINMAINHWLCSPLYSMLSLNITPSPPLPQTATSSMPQAAIPEAVAIAVPQAAPSMPEAVATAVPQAATSSMPKAAATAVPQASFKVGKLQKPIVYVCLPTNLDMVDTEPGPLWNWDCEPMNSWPTSLPIWTWWTLNQDLYGTGTVNP